MKKLITESRNQNTYNLDEMNSLEIVKIMNSEDKNTILAVEKEKEKIALVVDKVVEKIREGGRLIYCGAGTSGRIAVLDAVECVPTFGLKSDRVIALLAGTDTSHFAKEEAEDEPELSVEALKKLSINEKDILIGVAASGRTPYVIGALEFAKKNNVYCVSVSCNPNSLMSNFADIYIELNNGPEVLTGSTRLKAGTSQKMVLNIISTASMVRIGKVYQNLMVDVEVSNEKLKKRWLNIVCEITECTLEKAESVFIESKGNAKIASIMINRGCSYNEAKELLNANNDFLKPCLSNLEEVKKCTIVE